MKQLRLLQIVPNLESGGVERGTIDLSNHLAKKGCENFIISNGGKLLTLIHRQNITHINLPVHSKNPITIFKNIKKIRRIIKKNKINIINVRSRAPAWSAYYASKNICTSIATFHNVYGHNNLFKRSYNKGMSKMNYIIAISKYVKDSISKIYNIDKKKIFIIHRGVDTNFFQPNIISENDFVNFVYKFNLPFDKKIILFPGRITEWKGQIEFLDVLKNCNLNEILCIFAGDIKNNSYSKKLEKMIYKKGLNSVCKIIGDIDINDLRFMYKISDVIISAPLKPEGFGRIISEGLSMEKIVLSYNFGGAQEQISNLSEIYAVNPLDKKDMLKKINSIFELSPHKIQSLGKLARDHIINNFSKEKMIKKYINFYTKHI